MSARRSTLFRYNGTCHLSSPSPFCPDPVFPVSCMHPSLSALHVLCRPLDLLPARLPMTCERVRLFERFCPSWNLFDESFLSHKAHTHAQELAVPTPRYCAIPSLELGTRNTLGASCKILLECTRLDSNEAAGSSNQNSRLRPRQTGRRGLSGCSRFVVDIIAPL